MKNNEAPVLSSYRWVILGVCMLAGFIGSYAQFQLPPLAYKLIPDLHMTDSDFALLMGGPLTGSLFICLIGGSLGDRYGVKKVVSFGLILAVVGCTFRYATTSFWPFFFLTILAGLASGLLVANISKLFGSWFAPDQMGTLMGVYMVSPMLAGTLATATTPYFPSEKSAFVFSGVACFAILVLWLVFAKNKPEGAPDLPSLPVTRYIGMAARSRAIWLAGLCSLFVMGSMMTFTGFLPKVLGEIPGIDRKLAGTWGSLPNLGGIFGSFLGPLICKRLGVMKPYVVAVSLLGAIITFWSWQLPVGPTSFVALVLAGGLQSAILPLILSIPVLLPEIGPTYAGSAGGIITTLQVFGGVVVPSYIITRIAGSNPTHLFGLTALCCALIAVPALFLPELGSRALAAKAARAGAASK
jgi:cyanate permease